jgi:hypothetical protein
MDIVGGLREYIRLMVTQATTGKDELNQFELDTRPGRALVTRRTRPACTSGWKGPNHWVSHSHTRRLKRTETVSLMVSGEATNRSDRCFVGAATIMFLGGGDPHGHLVDRRLNGKVLRRDPSAS